MKTQNLVYSKEKISKSGQKFGKQEIYSEKQLMNHCYYIIQEQERHIDNLELNIRRQNSIIKDLLEKKTQIKTKVDYQQLKFEVEKLRSQIQYIAHQNQCLRISDEEKGQAIEKFNLLLKEKQSNLLELNSMVSNLKQAYETKISMLLQQLKTHVLKDINGSALKNNQSVSTPIKLLRKKNFEEDSLNKQNFQFKGKSSRKTLASTVKKMNLLNFPYLVSKNQKNDMDSYRVHTEQSEKLEKMSDQKNPEIPLSACSNLIQIPEENRNKKVGIKNYLESLAEKMKNFIDEESQ